MSSPSNNPQNPQQPQDPQSRRDQPGLWAAHAEYIKGAAESTIGSVTGSQSWSTSGEQDKSRALAALQAAAQTRDPAKAGYGRAEEIAGKLTGCEGMKHEGAASKGAPKRRD